VQQSHVGVPGVDRVGGVGGHHLPGRSPDRGGVDPAWPQPEILADIDRGECALTGGGQPVDIIGRQTGISQGTAAGLRDQLVGAFIVDAADVGQGDARDSDGAAHWARSWASSSASTSVGSPNKCRNTYARFRYRCMSFSNVKPTPPNQGRRAAALSTAAEPATVIADSTCSSASARPSASVIAAKNV